MTRTAILEGREISYELTYKKVRNINIRIKPGGNMFISAPASVSFEYIDDLLLKRSSEILKTIDRYSAIVPETEPKEDLIPCDGQTVYYLGEPLALKIVRAASNMAVKDGRELVVYSVYPDDISRIRLITEAWYDVQSRRVLSDMGHRVYQMFKKYVPEEPVYSYKKMKSLWGSCNPVKCHMSINRDLIKYDMSLIEFVFCHEYTHFIHPDHSPGFYSFLASVLPDHRERREKLKRDSAVVKKNSL